MHNQHLTVTALTKYIKYKFDNDRHLKQVLLKGEISNFKHHSRGHFYLSLKDDGAQIGAMMFAKDNSRINFTPKDGDSVIVEGFITVYEPSGSYRMTITSMQLDGVGNLYIEYEKLKKKLAEQGLFDIRHKKALPKYPKAIGVCTSPTGAAVRDIIDTVSRRYPLAKVIIYPTLVQGDNAKDSIVKNIELANKQKLVDVLIVGRGGGSIEDLWAFNEEIVAHAIYNSELPIISSVGHETDTTIADYVADLRAPTPTAGAEVAVPDKLTILQSIKDYEARLEAGVLARIDYYKERMGKLNHSFVFRNPSRIFEQYEIKLDRTIDKFNNSFNNFYARQERRLNNVHSKLLMSSPKAMLEKAQYRLTRNTQSLDTNYKTLVLHKQSDFKLMINKLELLNPLSIMDKGYSLTKVNGRVLNSVKKVAVNDVIDISLKDGDISAKIVNLKEK